MPVRPEGADPKRREGSVMGPALVIVNGAAGEGRCAQRARNSLERLAAAGAEVRWTEGPGHATTLARDAATRGDSRVIAVGGDGTAFEVLNGLLSSPQSAHDVPLPTLCILPFGTGNSFLRDVNIFHARDALLALERGRVRPVDVIRVTHQSGVLYCMNLVSIGFAARAGALMLRRFRRFGAAGYVAAVLFSLVSLEPSVDPVRLGQSVDRDPALMLAFCNSRYTGGRMLIAPHASLSDGKLDVIRVQPLSRARFLRIFPAIFSGAHVQKAGVDETQTDLVEFLEPREQDVLLDGEVMRLTLQKLDVIRGAVQVIA